MEQFQAAERRRPGRAEPAMRIDEEQAIGAKHILDRRFGRLARRRSRLTIPVRALDYGDSTALGGSECYNRFGPGHPVAAIEEPDEVGDRWKRLALQLDRIHIVEF